MKYKSSLPAVVIASSLSCSLFTASSYSQQNDLGCWQSDQTFLPHGLPCGALHEFFLAEIDAVPYVPSGFIIAGISNALSLPMIPGTPVSGTPVSGMPSRARNITVWIGRDRWPTPHALPQALRAHAYFLHPRSERELLWALDAALKCPAVGAVVTHYDRLPFNLSQRFALAARTSGVIGIFTRPQKRLATPSAAPFRWEIKPVPYPIKDPGQTHGACRRWLVTLIKAKHALPANNTWIVDYEDETFSLRISTAVVSGGSEILTQTRNTTLGHVAYG